MYRSFSVWIFLLTVSVGTTLFGYSSYQMAPSTGDDLPFSLQTRNSLKRQIFDNRTMTLVNELRPEQRVREIAQIMGGSVTDFSMKSAEEMLARSYLWKENFQRRHSGTLPSGFAAEPSEYPT